eukprot:TRINITY_DN4056_c1_g1_i1.p1 TRINITY_DN4056_c1_g1~~TRINITY_DN4056_c1_g1_i1.p1  ORF type:complete len:773 (+),score=111.67 TRINITY_DN4056_c1_g1_i1:48-2321(+)
MNGVDGFGGDLTSYLLSEVDTAQPQPADRAFGTFKRALRGNGVPFSAIKSATPRERADLANAVYPKSEQLQEEVLKRWPSSGPLIQSSVAWRQQDAELRCRRNGRRRSASDSSSVASRSSCRSRSVGDSEGMYYRQPKIRTPQGKAINPRMKIEKEKQRKKPETKLWQSPAVARARAAARAAEVRGRSRSQSQSKSVRGRSQESASSARSTTDWLGRSSARSPQRRSGSSVSRQPSYQRSRCRSTSTTRSNSSKPKQTTTRSSYISSVRPPDSVSRASSTNPTPRSRSRSPSPFNSNPNKLILPVGTPVVTCRLSKTAPEMNNIRGTVTAPAKRDSYVPVTFPAPFNDMVVHISKLRPYSEVANERGASLPRRASLSRPVCRTGRVFTDFRWLHPCNPPPPPPAIVEHAESFKRPVPKASAKKSAPASGKKRRPGPKSAPNTRKQRLRREQAGAIGAQKQEVRNAESVYGPNSIEVVTALWRLSIVLSNEELVEEAIPHARCALQIVKDIIADGKHSSSDLEDIKEILLGVKCTLAAALHDDGQHAEAIRLFTPSKSPSPNTDTEGHSNITVTEQEAAYALLEMHNLSVLYEKSGDFIAAEPHARGSIQGLSSHYGHKNSVTTASLCNLALILYERGESVEAALLATRALQELADTGPAGKMRELVQKLVDSVPARDLADSALLEKQSSARTGITWCNTMLAGIAMDSPADYLMTHFKGRKVREVGGRSVTCDSEIRSCCEDAVFIVFTFDSYYSLP